MLQRHTPIRRATLKRTGLKRKRSRYPSAAALRERRAWGEQFNECWVCGASTDLQTHEIASRSQAPSKWADVRNYFRACSSCNCDFLNWCPEAVQLSLKSMYDPDNYDREFICALRHRGTLAISAADVGWWIKVLRNSNRPQG